MASKANDMRQSVKNQLRDNPGLDKDKAYRSAIHVSRAHRRRRPN